jgi:unsaturated rhamnogalacturonyl hydrolase
MSVRWVLVVACGVLMGGVGIASGQGPQVTYGHATAAQLAGIAKDNSRHFGDDPVDGGAMAKLSPKLTPGATEKAIRLVGDWELARSEAYFDRIWTWSVLYSGFMGAADELKETRYRDAMQRMGARYGWELRSKVPNADDESVGSTYEELYLGASGAAKDKGMIGPLQGALDAEMVAPFVAKDDLHRLPWWWCDALFMAPPVWARMEAITGDKRYAEYLDKEWAATSALLYDGKEHLYARDASYLTKTEANGKKMFWSRGNGWVMGGLVRTLEFLPKDDPSRGFYVEQLKEMAARVAELQGKDGLWRAGLLDQENYDLPEVSGSALFTYALAWGVNEGILDGKVYKPVIARAWKGMLGQVYADGRLGCIEQTGAEPAPFRATASYNYGVGGFLLAGSEVHRMSKGR